MATLGDDGTKPICLQKLLCSNYNVALMTPVYKRFLKYTLIGGSTFLLDLVLLFLLVEYLLINYAVAAGIAFLLAVSVNYLLSRQFVFRGSLRTFREGYVHFLGIALLGIGLVVSGTVALVEWIDVPYLMARVLIALVTGLWNYLMNLFVNFRVAGLHL